MPLKPGDPAPDFERRAADGRVVSLAALHGRRVVLFFYPKDGTPVCTREACRFRDRLGEFENLRAEVIGVSADGDDSHRDFAQKHALRYSLIADPDRSLRRQFGVGKVLGLLDGRETFVIDEGGVIRRIIRALLSANRHVDEALEALRGL